MASRCDLRATRISSISSELWEGCSDSLGRAQDLAVVIALLSHLFEVGFREGSGGVRVRQPCGAIYGASLGLAHLLVPKISSME